MLYRGMNRTQLDAAYNNSVAVPERDTQLSPTGAARNATVRREHDGHLNIHYGGNSRERLDLFLAANPKAPILAFIHGGYWQMYNAIGIAPEIRDKLFQRFVRQRRQRRHRPRPVDHLRHRHAAARQRGLAQRSHRARQLASSSGTFSTLPQTRSITGGSR